MRWDVRKLGNEWVCVDADGDPYPWWGNEIWKSNHREGALAKARELTESDARYEAEQEKRRKNYVWVDDMVFVNFEYLSLEDDGTFSGCLDLATTQADCELVEKIAEMPAAMAIVKFNLDCLVDAVGPTNRVGRADADDLRAKLVGLISKLDALEWPENVVR